MVLYFRLLIFPTIFGSFFLFVRTDAIKTQSQFFIGNVVKKSSGPNVVIKVFEVDLTIK